MNVLHFLGVQFTLAEKKKTLQGKFVCELITMINYSN